MTDELPIVLLHGSATGSYSWAAVRKGFHTRGARIVQDHIAERHSFDLSANRFLRDRRSDPVRSTIEALQRRGLIAVARTGTVVNPMVWRLAPNGK